MKMNIARFGFFTYSAGFVSSIGIGIYDANKLIQNKKQKNGEQVGFLDYAAYSYLGACSGALFGLVWPLTAFGRLSVKLFSSKN